MASTDWRERFLSRYGPGVLCGITLSDWVKLMWRERGEIDAAFLPRVCAITLQSLKTSLIRFIEDKRYGALFQNVAIEPPLFVLGHWRNGTTHLHQLIARDVRFAFPTTYQVSFPRTFLMTESVDSRLLSVFMPKHRPMDNVELNLGSPQEDEFALCTSCLKSPFMACVFPRQKQKFERYLTFSTAEANELAEWKEAFLYFIKKLQWRHGRPLVLKSPPHTARIRLLLELFPQARFVHIHRDPYRVFQSSRRLFLTMFTWNGLQRPKLEDLDEWILRQYHEMYSAFFEQRSLIPSGRLCEVAFEQLEQDPIGEMRKLYETLSLPDFSSFEPELRRYVNSVAGYRKNIFEDLPIELAARVSEKWRTCFREWGYPTLDPGGSKAISV
jgi:hypothetical protein